MKIKSLQQKSSVSFSIVISTFYNLNIYNLFTSDIRHQIDTEAPSVLFEINEEYSMPTNVFNEWFELDSKTGVVRTRYTKASGKSEQIIDYESYKEVLLGIDVIDSKTFEKIESIVLKIKINNLNDNSPEFSLHYDYKPEVFEDNKESVSERVFITKFLAFDLDETKSEASKLSYSIKSIKPNYFKKTDFLIEKLPNSDAYALYKASGVNLDRDDKNIRNLITINIEVNDNESVPLATEKEILVNLIDINDNSPQITNDEELTEIILYEDHELGTAIKRIKVKML